MGNTDVRATRGRPSLLSLVGAVGIGAATAAMVALVVVRERVDDRVPAAEVRSVANTLGPEPQALRYRFALRPANGDDALAGMAALEARAAQPTASAIDLGELAGFYLRRGTPEDLTHAQELAQRSLALLPTPNGAALTLAKIATARHEFREAITIATAYLTSNSSIAAYQILATSYLAVGELPAAAAAAEMMTNERPSSGAYFTRALVEQAKGREAEAAFDFARAAALEEPGDLAEAARLRTLWGRFALRRGDTAGATMLFAEALRIVPQYPLALANQGELALRTGNTREAKAKFEEAFVATRAVRYLIDQARAQEAAGDRTTADVTRTQVEKLVRAELASGGLGHALELVEILVDRALPADLVEAIAIGREEVARRPSTDVHFQLARAYARSGQKFDARTQIQAALASGVRDARVFELASRIETLHGNTPRAQLYTREAAALDPRGATSMWRTLGMAPR